MARPKNAPDIFDQATTVDTAKLNDLKAILEMTGSIAAEVISNSMWPIIKPGDTVKVAPFQKNSLNRFDILACAVDNRIVCHYLWHKNYIKGPNNIDTYITRAMGAKRADFPIQETKILGIVVNFKIPFFYKVRELIK